MPEKVRTDQQVYFLLQGRLMQAFVTHANKNKVWVEDLNGVHYSIPVDHVFTDAESARRDIS